MTRRISTPPAESTPSSPPRSSPLRDRLGICQWFHFHDYRDVERTVEALHDLGVKHLRTGISWADLHRPGAKEWFDWQMAQLAGFEVLVSVWHTPPSLSEAGACNAPPRRLRDYADAIDLILTNWGDQGGFTHLELWNEPNNAYKWNFAAHDPRWEKFAEMIRDAAYWAQHRGKPTVLGGMIPVDHHWLDLMDGYGVLQFIDAVAIHAFPGMWWPGERNWDWHERWTGWRDKLAYASSHARGRPVWVTETGVATWDLALHRVAKYELQVQMLEDVAAHCTADRVYWYSLIDLDPAREAIEGFHVDENEYHMGLIDFQGHKKDAYYRFKELLAEPARVRRDAGALART